MNRYRGAGLSLALLTAVGGPATAASFLERLGLTRRQGTTKPGVAALNLSEEEVTRALKDALDTGVLHAVATLSRENGFLKDSTVRIPLPDTLKRVESGLRAVGQGELVDGFVTSMNRAAEKAAPEAAEVLASSIRQMTLTDARAILTGTNNAATAYFRRTSETNLYARLQPIVGKATQEAGVTGAYKAMTRRAGLVASLLGADSADLDAYITRRALDGLFVKIAEEEQRIREDPVARTTELLQKVFGSVTKP